MPWSWYHEAAVWLSAAMIQLIVVRWCSNRLLRERWRSLLWRAYPLSLLVCAGYTLTWAPAGRHFDVFLVMAVFDALVVWPLISVVVCLLVLPWARHVTRLEGKQRD